MRVSPERLRARELPRVMASRAFRRRLLQGLGVVAVLAVVFRWLLGLSPGPESPWALAGLTVLWSLYAVREALDHAAGHRLPRTSERPPRAAARCGPADKPAPQGAVPRGRVPRGRVPWGRAQWGAVPWGRVPWGRVPWGRVPWGRVPWRDLRPGFLPVLGPGLALLAMGGGRYGVALCLAVGSGLAALVDAVSFAARCHRDLPDAPRTAVRIVGFTDPVGRGLVLQPVAGGPCLAVADAWNWREDLATGDVLTWLGLWDAAGRPWRPPVRALCCPGRTHLVRHVTEADAVQIHS